MLPVPLWNLPEETDRGLGEWGCYGNRKEHTWRQSPERSREGWEGERERGKSLCAATATVFSGEMRTRQNGKDWGSLAAAIRNYDISSPSAQPRETICSMQPRPCTQQGWGTYACRPKHRKKYTPSLLFNYLSFSQTAQSETCSLSQCQNKQGWK